MYTHPEKIVYRSSWRDDFPCDLGERVFQQPLALSQPMFSDSHNMISRWGWAKLAVLGLVLVATLKSGIWPKEGDSKTWYDRAIRIVGSILLFLVFAVGIYRLLHRMR
jgi:hypothetical protein